jgi:hypothetical protein
MSYINSPTPPLPTRLKRLAAASALLLSLSGLCAVVPVLSGRASASDSGIGSITQVISNNSGRVFVTQNGSRSTRPACAVDPRWVINGSTETGKAMLASMLTAYATNRQILILGTGACADWGDSESIAAFYIY